MWIEAMLSLGVLVFVPTTFFRMNRLQEEIDILRQCSNFAHERIMELEMKLARKEIADANNC